MLEPRPDRDRTETQKCRLDLLAVQALENLTPLSFEVARTPLEIDAVFRMRYECVTEMGWAKPDDYPDGRERDEHDEGATFVLGRDGEEIIASVRIIPPIPGELLPAEREFQVRVSPPGRWVQAGRVIVPQRFRSGRSHLILAGLFARVWLVARDLGYDRVMSTSSATMIDLYRGLGLIVTEIAPSKFSWGEERSLIELAGTERSMSVLAQAAGVGPLQIE